MPRLAIALARACGLCELRASCVLEFDSRISRANLKPECDLALGRGIGFATCALHLQLSMSARPELCDTHFRAPGPVSSSAGCGCHAGAITEFKKTKPISSL